VGKIRGGVGLGGKNSLGPALLDMPVRYPGGDIKWSCPSMSRFFPQCWDGTPPLSHAPPLPEVAGRGLVMHTGGAAAGLQMEFQSWD
jgi:hypothetical protein